MVEIADGKQTPWEKSGNGLKAMIQFGLTEGKTASVLLKSVNRRRRFKYPAKGSVGIDGKAGDFAAHRERLPVADNRATRQAGGNHWPF